MSLDDFQLLDNETDDNSMIQRVLSKVYHRQGARKDNFDQNIEIIFAENINYHQISNAYLEYEITLRKN